MRGTFGGVPKPKPPPPSNDWIAFVRLRPALVREHRGRFALFHDGELIGVYDDREAARDAGRKRWPLGPVSVIAVEPGEPSVRL